MTPMIRSVGFVLALVSVGLGGGALAWAVSSPAAAQSAAFTPLPPGWDCVSSRVSQRRPPRPISRISTSGNSRGWLHQQHRGVQPLQLPADHRCHWSPDFRGGHFNNFPAFSTWAAGCSATVATLYQPNMWVITAALRAGNVTPATAFLAVVDQSAWCAVSPAGIPCYVTRC